MPDDYILEVVRIAEEVRRQAETTGFGMSDLQIKYADGKPVIVVNSHTENRKYADNEEALADIAPELGQSIARDYDGTRTFTAVFHKGKITRLLVDDYRNNVL